MCSGESFLKTLRNGKDINDLLVSLTSIIESVSCSAFKRAQIQDNSIDGDDISQQVRIFLWKKLPVVLEKMEGMHYENIFKYVTTMIKNEAIRVVMGIKCTNPRLKKKRRVRDLGVELATINLEFFDYRAEYPIACLLDTLKERVCSIQHGSKVLKFLITTGAKEDFAGLPINKYFDTTKKIAELAKEIGEEVGYV